MHRVYYWCIDWSNMIYWYTEWRKPLLTGKARKNSRPRRADCRLRVPFNWPQKKWLFKILCLTPLPWTPDSDSYTPEGMETSTGNCELSLGVLSLDDVVQISSITRDEGNPAPVPVPSSSVICEGDLISSPSVSSLHESPFGRSSHQPELLKFSGSSMGSLPSPVSKLLQKKFLEAL